MCTSILSLLIFGNIRCFVKCIQLNRPSSSADDFSYRRERGWFPRRCVKEVVDEHGAGDSHTGDKKDN